MASCTTEPPAAPQPPPTAMVSDEQLREWESELDAAARRPLRLRFRYSFIHTYKPVLDDARFRSFDSTSEYRQRCEKNLPNWLGLGSSL